jgi:hypothetical protein
LHRQLLVEDIMPEAVINHLPFPLANLEPGSGVFILRPNPARLPFRISLSHPMAPHQPEFTIDWVSSGGDYLLIHENVLDPGESDPVPGIIVRLKKYNSIEILPPDELKTAREMMLHEISAKISLPPRELDAYVAQLLAAYMIFNN